MESLLLKNPFTNAKVVGAGVSAETYLRQEPDVKRGDPQFVMSRSELCLFASNPQRWIKGYEFKETDATEFGDRIDCFVTNNAKFGDRFAVRPATIKATKSMNCVRHGEAEVGDPVPWQHAATEAVEWKAAHKGKTIISPEEMDETTQACARLTENPDINEFIACSAMQVMVVAEYHDRETGIVVPFKSLIDFVPDKDSRFGRYLGDLKTCRSAEPHGWDREVDKRNYDAQAGANLDIYTAATGEDRDTFVHILLENVFPFEPNKIMLSFEYVNYGRMKIVGALRNYCRCLADNNWPTWTDFHPKVLAGFILCEPDQRHSQLHQSFEIQRKEPAEQPESDPNDVPML